MKALTCLLILSLCRVRKATIIAHFESYGVDNSEFLECLDCSIRKQNAIKFTHSLCLGEFSHYPLKCKGA